MAKSISGGLGTVNLSVQELRLLGGTFTTLDTTTLTVLGTATLGSLTISGTFTINQLTSNEITTQNLTATGTTTITTTNDTADNNNKIVFLSGGGTSGILKSNSNLHYNPNADKLTVGNVTGSLTGDVLGNVTGNVTGDLTGDVTGNVTGDVTGNVTGSLTGDVTGDLTGNVTGSLTGDVTGDLTGNVTGSLTGNVTGSLTGDVTGDLTGNVTGNVTAGDVSATTQIHSPSIRVNGSNSDDALMTITTFGLITTQPTGYVWKTGTNNRLAINTTQTRIYNALQCDSTATITGLLTCDDITATGSTILDDVEVEGLTINTTKLILANVSGTGTDEDLPLLMWDNVNDNKVKQDESSLYYNPDNSKLTTTNADITGTANIGTLNVTTLNVGNQSITNFTVTGNLTVSSGDLTLSNLPNPTAIQSYALLIKQSNNDKVVETAISNISVGVDLFGATHYLQADELRASNFIVKGTNIPLGYTTIYSCNQWATNIGRFGLSDQVLFSRSASEGGSPTVSQYGANIFSANTIPIRSAIKYPQGSNARTHWGIVSNTYAGIWRLDLSAVFQNLYSQRVTPKIKIQKLIGGSTWTEQPQMSVGIQYTRVSSGELTALKISGCCHMASTSEVIRIITLLEKDTVNNPPTFPDSITSSQWAGREITVSMTFMGSGDETVDTL